MKIEVQLENILSFADLKELLFQQTTTYKNLSTEPFIWLCVNAPSGQELAYKSGVLLDSCIVITFEGKVKAEFYYYSKRIAKKYVSPELLEETEMFRAHFDKLVKQIKKEEFERKYALLQEVLQDRAKLLSPPEDFKANYFFDQYEDQPITTEEERRELERVGITINLLRWKK